MTLLFIDDDDDDRDLFFEAMMEVDASIHCLFANSGTNALNQLAGLTEPLPDLIFLDINMPVMNGWQCLTHLKQETDYQSIPVVMYSTSSYLVDSSRAHEAGALGLVTKPSDYLHLKQMLKDIVGHIHQKTLTDAFLKTNR